MAMLSNQRVYETSTERCEKCVRTARFMLLKAWFLSLTEFSNDSTCWSLRLAAVDEFLWFLTCSSALSCFVKVVIQKGRAINTFCHTRKMLRCRTASSMPFAGKCFLEWICGHSLREAVHSSFDRKKKACVQTCRLLPKGGQTFVVTYQMLMSDNIWQQKSNAWEVETPPEWCFVCLGTT